MPSARVHDAGLPVDEGLDAEKGASLGTGDMPLVLIIGSGPYAQSFASMASRTGALQQYTMAMTSRRLTSCEQILLEDLPEVPIVSIEGNLLAADIVVMAVPASSLPSLVADYGSILQNKVIIDVSNPSPKHLQELGAQTHSVMVNLHGDAGSGGKGQESIAHSVTEWLTYVLDNTKVVKSCCNLSSYILSNEDPLTEQIMTVVAGSDAYAAATVSKLLSCMGIQARITTNLGYARTMEGLQKGCLNKWWTPFWMMFFSWLGMLIYGIIRYNWPGAKGVDWAHLPLWVNNKCLGWVGLWGLLYIYAPGVLVKCVQVFKAQREIAIWDWVKKWMEHRKQLGVLVYMSVWVHITMSTLMWGKPYFAKAFIPDDQVVATISGNSKLDKQGFLPIGSSLPDVTAQITANGITIDDAQNSGLHFVLKTARVISQHSKMTIYGELFFLAGVAATICLTTTLIATMPSVAKKLNWREWMFMQSFAGWAAVIFATTHVMVWGNPTHWRADIRDETWPAAHPPTGPGIPSITFISTCPMMLLIALKIGVDWPPISYLWNYIRKLKPSSQHASFTPRVHKTRWNVDSWI